MILSPQSQCLLKKFSLVEYPLHFPLPFTENTQISAIIRIYENMTRQNKKERKIIFMENKRILIVDDEKNIRNVIGEYAKFDGFETAEAADGMEAVEMCRKEDYDLIIMDIMMPKLDGYSAVKEIRKTKQTPVIMLSARGEEYDKLFGFELGVDDYVTKPFSPKELLARIRAVIKRSAPAEPTADKQTLTFEGLEIDMSGRVVKVDGTPAALTPKEYDLLFYLVRNKGIALSREKLLEEVWGYDFYGDDRTVDTHIKMLRNSLGEYRKFIITLRGMGYKFDGGE